MRTSIIPALAAVALLAGPAAAQETPVVTGVEPSATQVPGAEPTATPSAEPTATPSAEPTATPSAEPTATPSAARGVEIPDFSTHAWIVADMATGDVLAGQAIDEPRPMASTIKTLTALTLLPRLQHDSTYEAIARETLTEGAHAGVLAGNHYTVEELFHGMLMRSGNDAAVALADAYGYRRTIDAMNAEADRIGADDTVAKSPNGLDAPGQVSTAADLAQIYRAVSRDPRFGEILTSRTAPFPGRPPFDPTQERADFILYNNDLLLNNDFPGFLGGKSGFTSQAGRTYVAGAEREGSRLVVALLGIGGGTTETAGQILDWAFANLDSLTPVGRLPALPPAADVVAEPASSNADPTDLAPVPPDPAVAALMQQVDQAVAAAVASAEAVFLADPQAVAGAATSAAGQAVAGAARAQADPGPPAGQVGAQRGLLASLAVGLLKALLWLVLLLGVAVVLLRVRAVRRRRRRREEAMRRRAGSRPEQPTGHRVPTRTG
jgi:D-alanyl-D-alanine carboxypeptidase (penicillin-binding protein 5/6)